jgi:uncharacterized protein involved in exopolysaccharide biosynthesis
MPSAENLDLIPYRSLRDAPGLNASAGMVESEGIPWARYIEALKRHLLLIVAIVLAGSALGFAATRAVVPVYDAQSTVWIAAGLAPQSGPIGPQQLLPPGSWIELLRSHSIVEPVVSQLRLNVHYKPADSLLFAGFESLPSLRPGAYVLQSVSGER